MKSIFRRCIFLFLLAVSPILLIVSSPNFIPPVRATNPPRVEVTILSASAGDDLDPEPFKGSGECYLESTATTTGGSSFLRWPGSGTANCDDHANFFNNNGQTFTLYPNFIILPEQVISGGVSFHVEGWEEDLGRGAIIDPDDTFGSIDFTLSDSNLAAMNGCSIRSDATAGGEKPLTITTQICVTPVLPPTPSCSGQNGIPPVINSTYTPIAPAAGTNFTVSATATASEAFCGITEIRISAFGSALATPETTSCYSGELPPTPMTCNGNFGPLVEGGYAIFQVRARDLTQQVSYEPPIAFDAGNPRSNSGWPAPTLLWGTHAQVDGSRLVGTGDRKDVIFFAATDYGANKAQFLSDAQNAIYNGVFLQPETSSVGPYSVNADGNAVLVSNASGVSYWVEESNRYRFNFWYVWSSDSSKQASVGMRTCGNPSGPCADQPSIPGCGLFDPCNWGFADTKAVFHTTNLGRDASWAFFTSCWCYSAQSGNRWIVLHEMGHNLWSLGDTYCCDAPYNSDSPHGNVWGSLSDCQNEATVSTPFVWPGANCTDITDSGHHYKSNPEPDIMSKGCFNCVGSYGASDKNRMEYVFRHMPDPVPSSAFSVVASVQPLYDVRAAPSQSPTGVCVSDPIALKSSIQACFPTGITTPTERPKMIIVVIAAYEDGTFSVLGSHVVYGSAPDPISDIAGHTTMSTKTSDGEHLEYYGLPNMLGFGMRLRLASNGLALPQSSTTKLNGLEHAIPPQRNVTVPFIFNFRQQSQNLTITASNGTTLLQYDVAPAVQSFCAANRSDPSCIPPAGSPTPSLTPPLQLPLITIFAPILIFILLVRFLPRTLKAKHSLRMSKQI